MSKFRIYFRSFSTAIFSHFVSKAAGFGSIWLLNRVLAKSSYGDYEFAFSVISLLLIIASAGLQHLALYRLSRLEAPPEQLAGHAMVRKLLYYSAITSAGVMLLVVVITPTLSQVVNQFWLMGLALLLPIKTLHGIYDAWYRSRQLIAETVLYFQLGPAFSKMVLLLLCWLLWPTVVGVVTAILLSELIPLIIRYFATPLPLFRSFRSAPAISSWDIKYAAQLAFTTGLSKTLKYSDILMMGVLSTSIQTAEYVIAAKLAYMINVIHGINSKIITPRIGKFLSENNYDLIKKEYHKSRIVTFSFSILGTIAFAWAAPYLLALFGDYQTSYSTLMILCGIYIVTSGFGMTGGYLNIAGYSNLTLMTTLIALLLNVGVNFWLIPLWGADGAAIAMLFSFGLTNVITASLIYYKDNLAIYSVKLALFTIMLVGLLLMDSFALLKSFYVSLLLSGIFVLFVVTERNTFIDLVNRLKKQLR